MKIECQIKSDRRWVSRAMRSTMGLPEHTNPISDELLRFLIRAGHSPAEEWEVWIDATVPERVHTHVVRHEEIGKYVATSRPDIVGERPKDGMRKLSMRINAKRLVEIMRIRLCGKAWWETRLLFRAIAAKVIELEPCLDGLFAPTCVWYGFCPEHCEARPTCGYMDTENYGREREKIMGKDK